MSLVHYSVTASQRRSVCVDKLSLSFDADASDLLTIARVGRLVRMEHSLYEHNYRIGSVLVQHRRSRRSRRSYKQRNSRIEFNPARASDLDWKLVRRVLKLAACVRVTRLDVAVGLPVSARRVQVLGDPRHKLTVISSPINGIETTYVGARRSRRQIVVYDKRQERADRDNVDEDRTDEDVGVTRFEARHRSLGIGLAELLDLADPFASLVVVELCGGGLHELGAVYASAFGLRALRLARRTGRV